MLRSKFILLIWQTINFLVINKKNFFSLKERRIVIILHFRIFFLKVLHSSIQRATEIVKLEFSQQMKELFKLSSLNVINQLKQSKIKTVKETFES